MREYEIMAIYDLSVAEAGGADASANRLSEAIERVGGKILKVDHWGRRRMAYPINDALDADYIVTRAEIDPPAVATLTAALNIDERVFRHIVVRADELPPPRPEPVRDFRGRPAPGSEAPAAAPAAAPAEAAAPAAEPAAMPPEGAETPVEPPAPQAEAPAAAEAATSQPEAEAPAEPAAEEAPAAEAEVPAAEEAPAEPEASTAGETPAPEPAPAEEPSDGEETAQ